MNLIHPLRRLPGVLLTAIGALASANTHAATITVTTVDDAIPPITDGECSLREAQAPAMMKSPSPKVCLRPRRTWRRSSWRVN
jgi:hypothetical protein